MIARTRRTSDPAWGSRGRRSIDPVAGLAGSIAHDFSNLLMIISNVVGFLKEDLEPEDPRQVHVARLLHASDRATRLTQQLQAIGRSQLLDAEVIRPADIVRGMSDTSAGSSRTTSISAS